MKQREAVFAAYTAALEAGMAVGTDQLFDHVADTVAAGITAGEVAYGKDRADEAKVKSYSRSVTSNWFKKDERIAGAKYVPATRRGPQIKDETLKKLTSALKSLKAHNRPEDMTLITKVQDQIEARRSALASDKAASKVQPLEETLASLAELGIEV
jgi:hypothetical protein